ncbi:MAG: 23S rRNA (pseudouridine(1915)-N(3))-methyltransferase RlmH [Clostridia bacterium]|mgnify:CR=1 FL=1|nr:23S rRNA (pseudouridine(1915)-N(3))-methyltransferase RlmH [Clostridia bacterium]
MNITIICVGKLKESYFKDAVNEYSKRLSKYCKLKVLEVSDEKTVENASEILCDQIMQKEGNRILSLVRDDAYVVTLEIKGKKYHSVEFADMIEQKGIRGISHITFIIGGSLGLHSSVSKRADEKISFSDMTFPHQLMRVILLEQIYRAYRIMNHEPYHK